MTGKVKLVRRCELTAAGGRRSPPDPATTPTDSNKAAIPAPSGERRRRGPSPRTVLSPVGARGNRPRPALPAAPCPPGLGSARCRPPSPSDTARACRGSAPSAMLFHLPGSRGREDPGWVGTVGNQAVGPWRVGAGLQGLGRPRDLQSEQVPPDHPEKPVGCVAAGFRPQESERQKRRLPPPPPPPHGRGSLLIPREKGW